MTKTQNPFIAAEWIRRAVNQDYIEDNLVEYDWILAQDEALAARILELGKQRGSAFALYRQGADAMQKGNTEEAITTYQKQRMQEMRKPAIGLQYGQRSRQTGTCPRKNSNRY